MISISDIRTFINVVHIYFIPFPSPSIVTNMSTPEIGRPKLITKKTCFCPFHTFTVIIFPNTILEIERSFYPLCDIYFEL